MPRSLLYPNLWHVVGAHEYLAANYSCPPVHTHTLPPHLRSPLSHISIQLCCSLESTGSSPSVKLPQTLPGRLKLQNLGPLICYLFIQWEYPWVPGDWTACVPLLGLLRVLALVCSGPSHCHKGHLAASG